MQRNGSTWLSTDLARVEVLPRTGGALGRYEVRRGDDWLPVLQTAPTPGRDGPFAQGCNILAPWSNRISGGGFTFDGVFHRLEPNIAGEPCPNHGNAFAAEWQVLRAAAQEVVLGLDSEGPGPFRYAAEVRYRLEGARLDMRLLLTNRADRRLPHGGGFHPWFVRTPRSRLSFAAAGYWSERDDHLPDRHHPGNDGSDFDFHDGRALPSGWINTAFTGWDGRARLDLPELDMQIVLTAAPPLGTLVVYSPGNDSDFVSVEPVSHSVDSHNRHEAGSTAPKILAPGESLRLCTCISPIVG